MVTRTHGANGATGYSGHQGNQGRGSQNVRWHNGFQYVWNQEKQDFVRWVRVGNNNVPILYKDALSGKTEEQCIAKHNKRRAKEVNRRSNPSSSRIKKDFQKIWASEEKNGVRLNETQVAGILKSIGYDETQAEQLARAYRAAYSEDPRDTWSYDVYQFSKQEKRRAQEVNRRIKQIKQRRKPSQKLIEQDFQTVRNSELRHQFQFNEEQIKLSLKILGYDDNQASELAEAYKRDYNYPPPGLRADVWEFGLNYAFELIGLKWDIHTTRGWEKCCHPDDATRMEVAQKLRSFGYSDKALPNLIEQYFDWVKRGSPGIGKHHPTNNVPNNTTHGTANNTSNIRQKGPDYAIEQAFKKRPTSADEVKKLFLSYGYSEKEASDLTGIYIKRYGSLFPPTTQNQPTGTKSSFTSPFTEALKALPDLNTPAGKQAFDAKIKEILAQRTSEQIKEDEDNIKTYKRMYDLYGEYSNIYKNDKAFAEEIRSIVFGDKSLPPEPPKHNREWVEWRLKKMAVDLTHEAIKDAQNEGEKLSERDAIKKGLYKTDRRLCAAVKDRFHTFEDSKTRAIRQLLLPNSSPDSPNRQFAKNCAWNVVNVDDSEIKVHLKQQAARAFDIIGQIADNIGVDLTQYPLLSQIKLTANKDAKYDGIYHPSSNTVEMTLRGMDKNPTLDTMVHELAHAVEFAVPGLRLTAALFRDEISDGTVVAHTKDDAKDNILGSTIDVPDKYSMREYEGNDEQSEIFSVFAQWFTKEPEAACVRAREFYERFAKALERRNRLDAMVSSGSVTSDEKSFVYEYESKLGAALSQNNLKVALTLYEQWLRDQQLLFDLAKGGDSSARLERQKVCTRLRNQIESMFRTNDSRIGKKLLKQIERLVSQ